MNYFLHAGWISDLNAFLMQIFFTCFLSAPHTHATEITYLVFKKILLSLNLFCDDSNHLVIFPWIQVDNKYSLEDS